jgi:hypothetical protein
MPKMEQTTEVQPQPELVLEPTLRKALQTKLTAYAALVAKKKALKADMDKLAKELVDLRDETGELSVTLEGYGTITYCGGQTFKKFNPKKFVQLGGNLAVYNEAVENKPKKAFDKITVPGVDEGGDDE